MRSDVSTSIPRVSRRGALAGGAAVAVVATGAVGWFLLKPGSARAATTIAVLPFENLSGDPSQTYFSDGLTEELRSALARAGLQVVGRTSSEAMKSEDAKTAAAKLGVGDILTGSVRRSPATIRVNAQLVKGSDGLERWSQEYDRKTGDELTIQSDIAENVAHALSIAMGAAKAAIEVGGTSNPAAQDLYLKARDILRGADNEAAYRQAIGLTDSAIALDPKFASAYAWKALALNYMTGSTVTGQSFETGYAQAVDSAKQAVALAPNLPGGHVALAITYQFQLNLPGALAQFRKAQSLPGLDVADQLQCVIFLTRMGAANAALDLVKQAQERDPLNPVAFSRQGYVLISSRRYAEAIAPLKKSMALAPNVSRTHSLTALALMQLGRLDEAEAEYRKAPPDDVYRLTGEAILFRSPGQPRRFRRDDRPYPAGIWRHRQLSICRDLRAARRQGTRPRRARSRLGGPRSRADQRAHRCVPRPAPERAALRCAAKKAQLPQSLSRRLATPRCLCHGPAMPSSTRAGGCFLTLFILAGLPFGLAIGNPMKGVLIGTGVGIAFAVITWLIDRWRRR